MATCETLLRMSVFELFELLENHRLWCETWRETSLLLDNFDKFIIALPHHINVFNTLNPEILTFIATIYIYIYIYICIYIYNIYIYIYIFIYMYIYIYVYIYTTYFVFGQMV